MRNLNLILAGVILVGLIVLASFSLFTVHQTQQALVLEFGRVVSAPITEPGLKVKFPPWRNVVYFEKRLLVHDNEPVTVDVGENERLIVDAFTRYKISDPLKFYRTVRVPEVAQQRIKVYLDSSTREVVGAQGLKAVISGERRRTMERIRDLVQGEADSAGLGIEIVDVRIKRADYPQQNSDAVFRRMTTERQKEAQLYRAEGEERKREIASTADRTVTILLAEAERRAQEIRGEGDAFRNSIFACAFGADPEFFSFYRTMQAYENSFRQNDTTMVLSPDSEFFKFFGNPVGSGSAAFAGLDSQTIRALRTNDPRCGADGKYNIEDIPFLDPEEVEAVMEEALPTEGGGVPSLLLPEDQPLEVDDSAVMPDAVPALTEEDGDLVIPPPPAEDLEPADGGQN